MSVFAFAVQETVQSFIYAQGENRASLQGSGEVRNLDSLLWELKTSVKTLSIKYSVFGENVLFISSVMNSFIFLFRKQTWLGLESALLYLSWNWSRIYQISWKLGIYF